VAGPQLLGFYLSWCDPLEPNVLALGFLFLGLFGTPFVCGGDFFRFFSFPFFRVRGGILGFGDGVQEQVCSWVPCLPLFFRGGQNAGFLGVVVKSYLGMWRVLASGLFFSPLSIKTAAPLPCP